MAYWDGGSGTRDGRRVPPTSDVRQIPSPNTETMTPDTEENVIDEAEDVIRNFIYESYRHQLEEDTPDSTTPTVPELYNFTSDPMRYIVMNFVHLSRCGPYIISKGLLTKEEKNLIQLIISVVYSFISRGK